MTLLKAISPCDVHSERKLVLNEPIFTPIASQTDNYSCIFININYVFFFTIDSCFFHPTEKVIYQQMAFWCDSKFFWIFPFDWFSVALRLPALSFFFVFFNTKCEPKIWKHLVNDERNPIWKGSFSTREKMICGNVFCDPLI